MKRLVMSPLPSAGFIDEARVLPVAVSFRIIDWEPPCSWTSDWETIECEDDEFPEYRATVVHHRILSSWVERYSPYVYVTATDRRWHVREWTDEETGERRFEREAEYRTRRY